MKIYLAVVVFMLAIKVLYINSCHLVFNYKYIYGAYSMYSLKMTPVQLKN